MVSSHSGMASILGEIAQNESVVQESSLETDEETWKDRIIRKLVNPEDSQRTANMLREQLLLDTKITQTHLDFSRIICGKILKMIENIPFKTCILSLTFLTFLT